jgi:hypothetical protein
VDLTNFRVGADRDEGPELECLACWARVDVQNWTLAQLMGWATAHRHNVVIIGSVTQSEEREIAK